MPVRTRLLLIASGATIIISALHAAETLSGANGLSLTEFAREPDVRNAVAVTVDEQERVFVTSVVRRQAADLDIRRFTEWIETDLSLTSVLEKQAWFQHELTPANSATYAGRFEDRNGDGSFDFADLALLADHVSRLEDTDGDGQADKVVKFNATENTAITGIAAGLAAWDGALYATVEPDLVRLTDENGDGTPDHRDVLATGFSVHIGYGGHNFSGAIIGPDGRLYASVADRGMHVTDLAGRTHYNPHSGAIVRCELDGSNFELFATGLRNVQEPAFNAFGDLIGVDNDGDFQDENERLVYITQGSDTGWRSNWQYRGDDWLPWMDEGLSIPAHAEQPAYLTPALQHYKDGPAGFAFNPGTALNPFYRDHFFLTAFPSRNLYAFKLEPDGPAYRMVGEHTVLSGALLVGVGFGPSGALYIADWSSSGYPMNEQGAVWKLDDDRYVHSTLRTSTAQLIAQDWTQVSDPELSAHLAHPDQRVRMKAQFELVKRGHMTVLDHVAQDASTPQLGRLHAIWGLGQLSRNGARVSQDTLLNLLHDNDPEVRAQTAKISGEIPACTEDVRTALTALLTDSAERPRFFAAIALGQHPVTGETCDALVSYLERDGNHPYHRHAGIMGLAGTDSPSRLAGLATHQNRQVRLAAVVALRKQADPAVTVFLADSDPLVVAEAAGAIHDDESIPAALPALAQILRTGKPLHERTARRALSAALRLRGADYAGLVADFARDETRPRPLRLHALRLLQTWATPARLDTVEGRHRPLESVDVTQIAPVVESVLADLSKAADHELAQSAWAAIAAFGISQSVEDLITIFEQDTPLSVAALKQLDVQEAEDLERLAVQALASAHTSVRQQALRILARISPATLVSHARPFFERNQIAESRVAITFLATAAEDESIAALRDLLEQLVQGQLSPDLALDVVVAAEGSDDRPIQTLLASYQKSKDAENPLAPFIETLHGGNSAQGQRVFETSVTAQCTLCHRIGRRGSNVGPPLGKIGQQSAEYILESLVNPGAVVAPGYGMISVSLKSGETLSGTLMSETATTLELKIGETETHSINLEHVASRTPAMSAMPPMGALMSRLELRDLIAYLKTLH